MRKLLLFTLALTLPALCSAQSFEAWVGGGISNLTNSNLGLDQISGSNVELQNGWRINFRMALNTGRWMGHELMYAYNRTNWNYVDLGGQEVGSAMHQGGYNFLLYMTPEGKSRVRPFATGGVHFANFAYPGYSATQGGGSTKFGYNYGAGVKFRVTEIFGFRLDYRLYDTGKPDFSGVFLNQNGRLKQNEFSVGIGVLL